MPRSALLLLFAAMSIRAAEDPRVAHLKEAAQLIETHRYSDAEPILSNLLKLDPKDPLALNLLGIIRLEQHRETEAQSLFQDAAASGRPAVGPHINLARLYAHDHPEDALKELAQALQIAPNNAQASALVRAIAHDSALAYLNQQRRDLALSLLATARQLLPADPDLAYEFGITSFEAGALKDSREALQSALKNRPGFPDALYALSRVELEGSHPQEAEKLMREYIAAKPDDPAGHYGLGYVLIAEQRLDDAQAAFEKSLSLKPDQTESVYQLGEIALEQDRADKARERFQQVLAKDPNHAGALTGAAMIEYRAAHYNEAIALLERAIAATPNYQKAHYYHALALSKLGRKDEADKEFAVARSLQKAHAAQ